MARTGKPAERRIESVERAASVLSTLAEARSELGTNEIARRIEASMSTVSRVLSTLDSVGLVVHSPDTGRYRLGVRLLQLANAARESLDIRSLARPHVERINQLTGETATLSIPGDQEAITVDFVQSELSVRSVAAVGRPSAAHATAVGKVFLAHGGELPRQPLHQYTSWTTTEPEAVRADADLARRRGWAASVQEREDDLNAVAVPVGRVGGPLVAIIGVQGPAGRFTGSAMHAATQTLLDQAAQLSVSL